MPEFIIAVSSLTRLKHGWHLFLFFFCLADLQWLTKAKQPKQQRAIQSCKERCID